VPDDGPVFYLGLQVGESMLGLVADGSIDLTATQRMLLSIEVPNVDDSLSQVVSAGGTVEGPPNDMPWGQRVAHVQDPDGNAINLTQEI
jgi:predicted enzyme related to lactoylglutathione lyase